MAKKSKAEPKPEVRNWSMYLDDFNWLDRAADYSDRSRIRLIRYCVSQWKRGLPVLLTVDDSKRPLEQKGERE